MCWATELEEPLSSGGWQLGCLLSLHCCLGATSTALRQAPSLPGIRAVQRCLWEGCCLPLSQPLSESSHGSACSAFPQANHSKKPGTLFSYKNVHLNPWCLTRCRDFCLLVALGIATMLRGLRDEPGIAQSPPGPCLCSTGLCCAWWWALPSPEVCTQGTLRWPQRGCEAPPARVFPSGGPGGAAAP